MILRLVPLLVLAQSQPSARPPSTRPQATLGKDGLVVGSLRLGAPIARVQAILRDPVQVGRLVPDVRSVVPRADGACVLLTTTSDTLLGEMTYHSRRCPTASGWREDMTHSEDLSGMIAIWSLTDGGSFTDVHFSLDIDMGLMAPDALVGSITRTRVEQTLENLRVRVEATP